MDVEQDQRRVVQIDRYQVLIDPPRQDLIALVEVAAQVAEMPIATIDLFTATEQHQIAAAGIDAVVCAREDALCNVVLFESEPVMVPDLTLDERFRNSPFVTGELADFRSYTALELRTPSEVVIGKLCVFDTVPRALSGERIEALSALADRVVDLLELELRSRELTETVHHLEQMQAELERSNKALAAFAGQVSHDLRNPLTAMDLSLSMVAEELETLPDEAASDLPFLVERARSGTRRMQGLVDELLAFAKVGGGEFTVEDVDLADVVEEVREDLAPLLAEVELEVDSLPVVRGDAVQLRAVLQNLIGNATVYVEPGEKPRILVTSAVTALGWRVEIVDHGLGVPADQRERIFEPLVRLRKEIPGSGIGLATVRQIVEAHRGKVGVAETPGGGATFWFELPA